MQTILGASGTISTILAKELAAYTDKVRLVSRNPRKINPTDELFPGDLSDVSIVDKAVAGSEVVYLTVGFEYDIQVWREKWPRLMRAVIDACKKHKAKLVFFDSVYMYDINAIPHMTENSPVNPPSQKGLVRKEIADMILKEVNTGQLTALIARAADFYGPKCDKSLFHMLVYSNMKKGKTANWLGDVNKKHTFTFTPDAAKGTALLGNTPDAYNQVWHLPTDKNGLTAKEYVAIFASEMKKKDKVTVVPVWMLKVLGLFMPFLKELPEMMYQYERDYIFDSSKFEKRFKFKPVGYKEGIRIMLEAEGIQSTPEKKVEVAY
ncbi:MAG TPA: NAD-dependent epimerase/dehydratase family protein [Bacteroidales bacterium]|nr:NAD-dependent epimerase/dehydratase family protein [Bacteroidales bacterium]